MFSWIDLENGNKFLFLLLYFISNTLSHEDDSG